MSAPTETMLTPFELRSACAKCGHLSEHAKEYLVLGKPERIPEVVGALVVLPRNRQSTSACLRRTCDSCGFRWDEQCADTIDSITAIHVRNMLQSMVDQGEALIAELIGNPITDTIAPTALRTLGPFKTLVRASTRLLNHEPTTGDTEI